MQNRTIATAAFTIETLSAIVQYAESDTDYRKHIAKLACIERDRLIAELVSTETRNKETTRKRWLVENNLRSNERTAQRLKAKRATKIVVRNGVSMHADPAIEEAMEDELYGVRP